MLTWSARILLFIFSIYPLNLQAKVSVDKNIGIDKKAFLERPQFYGTEPRREFEHKFAVELDRNAKINVKKLGKKITSKLNALVASKTLLFSQQIFSTYEVADKFESFVFKDIYLDTPNFDIQKANSAYRLRYRWVRQEKYYRNRLFPFLKLFYPNRCEIQFKGGYQRNDENGTIEVKETRFEFRNESNPFIIKKDAPNAPWKQSKFLKYAQSGLYLNFPILPMKELLSTLRVSKNTIDINPVIEVVTERYRTHINIVNPWGVGPNPDQAFIVTIDLASAKNFKNNKSSEKKLLEIEIEIDRNTSTEIDRISEKKVEPGSLASSAKEFSSMARKNLLSDLKSIEQAITEILTSEYKLKRLPVTNKYSRLVKPYLKD